MTIIVCKNYEELSALATKHISDQIKANPKTILGLATGSTPLGLYNGLSELCAKGELDFSEVQTFNLDEYYPISKKNEQSYDYFMNHNLFSKINIKPENVHIPNGEASDLEKECKAYDKAIEDNGFVDIQVLGIGQNGHIGFNEPDTSLVAGTHSTVLTQNTREANARFFASIDEVPTHAITMGMKSIMCAKKILLLINGKNKHEALMAMLDDKITTDVPATFTKLHPNVVLICDEDAYNG